MKLGRLHLGLVLLLATSGCKGKATDEAPAPATGSASGSGSATTAATPPPPPTTPGTLNLASLPPLGPPDAIEPPSRDIVPGMTIAEALAKGAKKDTVDYTLTWKPDVLDLWIDKQSGLVTNVQATYKKADFTALSAKWGKPNFGDAWLGANWIASLNGCQTDCTVTFERSPFLLIGATPLPPLGPAALGPTATVADAEKVVGVSLKDRTGLGTGFRVNVGADPSDKLLGAVIVDDHSGKVDGLYTEKLEKLWGPRVEAGDRKAWFSADRRWAVETDVYGDTLRYTPIAPAAEVLAKVRALPAKLWRKPKAAVAAALPDLKDDSVSFPQTEWAYGTNADGAEATVSYDDKGTVEELRITIFATSTAMKSATAAFEAAWGKPVKKKDEDGAETLALTVDGIPYVVTYDETAISLVARAPEPAAP